MKIRSNVALFLLGLSLSACGNETAQPEVDAPGQNPSGGVNAEAWLNTGSVVLISFDGFRWDYMDRFDAPTFTELAESGVRAEGMIPPFPTKTFPSHYSIATGLYSDGHGLVGNRFYDPERDASYALGDRETVEDGTWYFGEPIWVTAENQGMVAASYFFVGSEADVQGVRPSHWYPFDGSVSGERRVDQVVEWIAMPPAERPRMITLYFSNVDDAGHRYGPYAEETGAAVAEVDGYLRRLVDRVRALPHGDDVTFVLVSDHGMHGYEEGRHHAVDVAAMEGVTMVEGGPYGSIFVEGDLDRHAEVRDQIDAALPDDIGVYLRSEVPDRLHYRAPPRVGDIVIVPPLGVTVGEAGRNAPQGFTHGWDPAFEEMHAVFVANGPRITPGSNLGRIEHVDVYPLLAELLGLRPATVEGDLAVFDGVLTMGN